MINICLHRLKAECPRNLLGALLSIIDRIEILTSGYVLNMIPTGSRDPYALRRAATGVVRILLDFRLQLDLLADSRSFIYFV